MKKPSWSGGVIPDLLSWDCARRSPENEKPRRRCRRGSVCEGRALAGVAFANDDYDDGLGHLAHEGKSITNDRDGSGALAAPRSRRYTAGTCSGSILQEAT